MVQLGAQYFPLPLGNQAVYHHFHCVLNLREATGEIIPDGDRSDDFVWVSFGLASGEWRLAESSPSRWSTLTELMLQLGVTKNWLELSIIALELKHDLI